MKLHYYLYLARPPGIGCQPDNSDIDSREIWLPAQWVAEAGRWCFGRCGWPEPLKSEDVHHYSLFPEDGVERAELVFWKEGENGEWLKEEYMKAPDEKLQAYVDRDGSTKAWAALVLKKASTR